jgi:hypothetical protein
MIENLDKPRLKKTILVACMAIFVLDVISTFIGLNTVYGLYETNPVGAKLFELGFIGYIVDIIYTLGLLFLMVYFFMGTVVIKAYELFARRKINDDEYTLIFMFFSFWFFLSEASAIISNLTYLF